MSQTKQVSSKAGSNWKQLKRTLDRRDSTEAESSTQAKRRIRREAFAGDSAGVKKRKTSNGSSMQRNIQADSPSGSASPAPTSLPWFAEDLNEEDLALVRAQMDNAGEKSTSSKPETADEVDPAEMLLRRTKLLGGGDDLSPEKRVAGQYVAVDCEMVGVGFKGSESVLARVSLVNWHGSCLLDTFVKPKEKVTDYRTWVSGVRPQDLYNAPTFETVQKEVAGIIRDRILIGHAIHNDLSALLLSHPRHLIRDTATYPGSRLLAKTKYPSLRKLVSLQLGLDIQKLGSSHSSVEDAQATMALYRSFHAEWQQSLTSGGHPARHHQIKKRAQTAAAANGNAAGSPQIISKGWKNHRQGGKQQQQQKGGSVASSKAKNDDVDWYKTVPNA